LLIAHPTDAALSTGLAETWLWEILGAVAIGCGLGWLAARLMRFAEGHELIGKSSILTIALALAFTVVALVKLLGSDGILAAFAAGYVFRVNTDDRTDAEEDCRCTTAPTRWCGPRSPGWCWPPPWPTG